MTESTSRVVLGIEALLICLPLTLFFLATALPSLFHLLPTLGVEDYALAGASVFIAGTLLCGWYLIASFLFRGSHALKKVRLAWWALPVLSAALALAATLRVWLVAAEPSALNTFGWGLPLVIPLLHLAAERWWRGVLPRPIQEAPE